MKSIVFAFVLATVGATAAQAQVVNPDNDSAAFFAQSTVASQTPKPVRQPHKVGEVSEDGLYVLSGSDRGWVHQTHRYDIASGQVTHQTDSLLHNGPKPEKGGLIAVQSGPFAERGA